MEPVSGKSKIEWEDWGRRDPLFGVAGWEGKAKSDAHPWTDQEFFAVGEAHWSNHLRQWKEYGFNPAVCVEIGCGAGRITRQLADCFERVYALDISYSMLAYAARRVEHSRVLFCVTDGNRLPLADSSVTGAFSTYVFQHFDDVSEATAYFREIYRVLRGGCTMMISLPAYCWPGGRLRFLLRPLYRLRQQLARVHTAYQRFRLARGGGSPFCPGLQYEADWLHETLSRIGFQDVEIRIIPFQVHEGLESFVFCRKPPAEQHLQQAAAGPQRGS